MALNEGGVGVALGFVWKEEIGAESLEQSGCLVMGMQASQVYWEGRNGGGGGHQKSSCEDPIVGGCKCWEEEGAQSWIVAHYSGSAIFLVAACCEEKRGVHPNLNLKIVMLVRRL